MPNHVSHIVTVTGPAAEIARFKTKCFRAQRDETDIGFDFETLIPTPAIIKQTESSSNVDTGLALLGQSHLKPHLFGGNSLEDMLSWPWVVVQGLKTVDELRDYLMRNNGAAAIEAAKIAIQAQKETGHISWYEWNIANWGTKWNSYSFDITRDEPELLEFRFDTAWNTPEPIWEKLAEEFPTLRFEVIGYDEGSNFGVKGEIVDGENWVHCVEATDELYEQVYGEPPMRDEDEEEEA